MKIKKKPLSKYTDKELERLEEWALGEWEEWAVFIEDVKEEIEKRKPS